MRMKLLVGIVCLVCAGLANAAKVADYSFHNNLHSAVAGAPDLALVGTGTAYAGDTINGAPVTVLTFTPSSGLSLTPTTDILPSSRVYTIAMLAKFDDGSRFNKLIDFANGNSDDGLYSWAGEMVFYGLIFGTTSPIDQAYHSIVLTRDAGGTVVCYVDGVQQLTGDDSSGQIAVISATNTLRFFLDDSATSSEALSGAVAGIRIWDTALDDNAVAAIDWDQIFANGFETMPSP